MIIGCVIFYDDGPALTEACFKSLRKICDKVVAVDGAFAEFPHTDFNSPTKLVSLVRKYADKIIRPDRPWKDQVEKRNASISTALSGDYVFILDTDETVSGAFPTASELTEEAYKVKLITDHDGMKLPMQTCRLFRISEGTCYDKKHNMLINRKGKIISEATDEVPLLSGIEISHTPNLRGKDRLEKDGVYLRERSENGTPFPSAMKRETPKRVIVGNAAVVKLKALSKYHGYDADSQEISVGPGDFLIVTAEKAKQLLSDFPTWFEGV